MEEIGEVEEELGFAEAGCGFEVYANVGAVLLGLVDGEEEEARACLALGKHVFLFAGDAADLEFLGVEGAAFSVAVHHGVAGLLILVEEGDVDDAGMFI